MLTVENCYLTFLEKLQRALCKPIFACLVASMAFAGASAQTAVTAIPAKIYDNDVADGPAGKNRPLTIKNPTGSAVTITQITLSGSNANQFRLGKLPPFPKTLNANDSLSITVSFAPSATGLQTASVNIALTGAANSTVTVPLRGLGTPGMGGTNEPSLQALLNLLEIPIAVGDDDPSTNIINSSTEFQKAALLGDEISIPQFLKAGSGNVTIEPLAVFGPTDKDPVLGMGWYQSGDANTTQELFTVANDPATNAQTVNVSYSGTLSFDPGEASFGFYSRWPFFDNRHLYSEDNLNSFENSIPHHVRVFPYKTREGIIPNAYLIAIEEHISGFDYQDLVFIVRNVRPATNDTSISLLPNADAFVHQGTGNTNYGTDTTVEIKASASDSSTRKTYLKFSLGGVADVSTARLRLYGRNTEGAGTGNIAVFGVENDSWTERGLTFNNAPAVATEALGTIGVSGEAKYYELDVTSFVQAQFGKDKEAGFLLTDAAVQNMLLSFNSRENASNPPQLVIGTAAAVPANNTLLFIENLDKFPFNDHFVVSRVQIPWSRDRVVYNSNHDMARIRIHNKGLSPLIIKNFILSNKAHWKFLNLKGVPFDPATAFPLTINSGTYADLTMQFVATDPVIMGRIKVLVDTLTIVSNDENAPNKLVSLQGLWQRAGEGSREPDAQRIINAFGFKTNVGFSGRDPNRGDPSKPKGDEIISAYFVRADPAKPVTVRQMSAYHGCCRQTETIRWYPKGSRTTLTGIVTHIGMDAQSLLPRRSASGAPAAGSFSPSGAFGFRIGGKDWTDTSFNVSRKIAIRVWKAFDYEGRLIPDTYIISNDYSGTDVTNFDYNDNMYYVTNIRPEVGSAYFSALTSTPSAVDFGEKLVQSNDTFTLDLQSLGKKYANGSSDPDINISAVAITGENKGEFTATMPAKTVLNPEEKTTLTIGFHPKFEGLKIADLLIYYNNATSPYRVPLYGIGKDSGTTVKVHYRIKSGASTAITVGETKWDPDTPYAFDNLEPYANNQVTQIAATDDDELYFVEQSSNGDKKPFRYELPIANGQYAVRLHFAEVYWGTPGSGLSGGAGSRVMGINLENELRLANFDIIKEVGPAAALIKNFPVAVADGKLNMSFTASVNRPSLSAVEVYSFIRTKPPPPVDTSGTDTTLEKPKVYPNPSKGIFNVEFSVAQRQTVRFRMVDMLGRRYDAGQHLVNAGLSKKQMDLSSHHLKPGVYLLEILYENKPKDVIKIMLQQL